MNFLQLKYFTIVAEELNFTKAAAKIYISQQCLSKHISNLEKELSTTLFNRTTPLSLTASGEMLLTRSRIILNLANQTVNDINTLSSSLSGEITIGISRARGMVMLPIFLPRFSKEYPNVKINIIEGTRDELENGILDGSIDMAFGLIYTNSKHISYEKFMDERFVIVVPNSIINDYFYNPSEFINSKNRKYKLSKFAHCPFLTITKSTYVGSIFYKCCDELSIKPKIVVETSNMITLTRLCIQNLGIIICPEIYINQYVLEGNNLDNLSIFELDYNIQNNTIGFYYPKNKYLTTIEKEFIRISKETNINSLISH